MLSGLKKIGSTLNNIRNNLQFMCKAENTAVRKGKEKNGCIFILPVLLSCGVAAVRTPKKLFKTMNNLIYLIML